MDPFKALEKWLERVEASEQWTLKTAHTGMTVSGYIINCQLAVVVMYGEQNGWELLVPASNKNDTAATLDGAAVALGVDGCRGLLDSEGGAI